MSAGTHYFYVVSLPEGRFRTCLDGIRLLAEPNTRFPAHLTVRGPYDIPLDISPYGEKVKGAVARVVDIGEFFTDAQNTVFFHCSCPALLSVWDKPDYATYNPHITLYNGESRHFAESICRVVERYPIRYTFEVSGLDPLVSVKGVKGSLLRDRFDSKSLEQIIGERIDLEGIEAMSESSRLDWIDRIARHMVGNPKSSAVARPFAHTIARSAT